MAYLKDFILRYSGNECPESFLHWSALALLSASLGRKVFYMHGEDFIVYPNIYVGLVGTAGSGKSTAKGFTKRLFMELFPTRMISSSIQSREDIIQKMGSDECLETWSIIQGDRKIIKEHRPFFLIVNELSNFLSVDMRKMVDFLVVIFDENYFSTGFKNAASQTYNSPYMCMLACVQPIWIMSNLKLDLFSGGLGRRLILVVDEKKELVDEPFVPAGGVEALARVKNHLLKVNNVQGQFERTAAARSWWKKWYHDPKRFNREDPIIQQFHETKSIMLIKVAMLLSLTEEPFKLLIDEQHFEMARHLLDALEPKIQQLTGGIGRNELASVAQGILLSLHGSMDGRLTRKKVELLHYRNTPNGTRGLEEIFVHLQKTGQMAVSRVGEVEFFWMPEAYRKFMEGEKK